MRGLLILGCVALGLVLVAASHQDQEETKLEAGSQRVHGGDFVKDRDIRSTGGKKTKPPKWKTGVFSPVASLPKYKEKRSAPEAPPQKEKRNRCRGCFTHLGKKDNVLTFIPLTSAVRQQRDTEEHVKIKKQKHLKSKNKEKRRKHKGHKQKHTDLPTDNPEIGHNKKRKHHRGKKERTGVFTGLARMPPNMEKTDARDTKDMTE